MKFNLIVLIICGIDLILLFIVLIEWYIAKKRLILEEELYKSLINYNKDFIKNHTLSYKSIINAIAKYLDNFSDIEDSIIPILIKYYNVDAYCLRKIRKKRLRDKQLYYLILNLNSSLERTILFHDMFKNEKGEFNKLNLVYFLVQRSIENKNYDDALYIIEDMKKKRKLNKNQINFIEELKEETIKLKNNKDLI